MRSGHRFEIGAIGTVEGVFHDHARIKSGDGGSWCVDFADMEIFTGKKAFIVTFSPTVRVVLDTTGLSEEEVDYKMLNLAWKKISASPGDYINFQNVDWDKTKEDTECPYVEEPQYPSGCEPENGYGESKDNGLTGLWMIFDKGQQSGMDTNSIHPKRYSMPRVERIDEPTGQEPLESDEVAWELARLAGYDLDVNGYVCEFPHTTHI